MLSAGCSLDLCWSWIFSMCDLLCYRRFRGSFVYGGGFRTGDIHVSFWTCVKVWFSGYSRFLLQVPHNDVCSSATLLSVCLSLCTCCFLLYPFYTRLAACGARGPHAVLRPTCLCSRNAPFNQLGEERANDSRAYGLMCLLGQLLMIEALESAITGP